MIEAFEVNVEDRAVVDWKRTTRWQHWENMKKTNNYENKDAE